MFFKYTNLDEGLHQIQLKKPVEELEMYPPFVGEIVVDCNIDKSVRQIVLNCEAECEAEFICDRCNDTYSEILIVDFTLIKVFNEANAGTEDSNVEYLPPDVSTIDITKDLREFMLLSVPMKKLCSDDCKGLCINCGANLNREKCSCTVE